MEGDSKDAIIDLNNIEGEDRYYYCLNCGFLIQKTNFDIISFLFPYDPCNEHHLCPTCHNPIKRTIKKKKIIALIKKKENYKNYAFKTLTQNRKPHTFFNPPSQT